MNVIDLFSGCGGLSYGFIKNGFSVKKAVEFDHNIAKTYIMNHPDVDMIVDDIKNIDQSRVFIKGDADVIIGGPPCQGFSMAGARIRDGFIDDPRNYLFKHYFNVVKTVRPKVFIMENVKGIMTMQDGKIFDEILNIFSDKEMLDGQSYTINHRIVKAVDFGIPQKRERMIIIGTIKNDIDFQLMWEKTKNEIEKDYPGYFQVVTVADAISNLHLLQRMAKLTIQNLKQSTNVFWLVIWRLLQIILKQNILRLLSNEWKKLIMVRILLL